MTDPTANEMREYLASIVPKHSADPFDIECAIYWFANDYHGGQASNLYSALSASDFRPGPTTNGPEPGSMEAALYAELEDHFA
jgi:hypothetical protein